MSMRNFILTRAREKGIKDFNSSLIDYFQDVFLWSFFSLYDMAVFKGGTALYKIYGSRRFSFDLDIDAVEKIDIENVLDVVRRFGINTKIVKMKTLKADNIDVVLFRVQFSRKGIGSTTLGIDIGFVEILPPNDVRLYLSSYGLPAFNIRVGTLEWILSEKVDAFIRRRSPRDLFDIYFIISAYGKCLPRKKELLESLKFINERDWISSLEAMLLDYELPSLSSVREVLEGAKEC